MSEQRESGNAEIFGEGRHHVSLEIDRVRKIGLCRESEAHQVDQQDPAIGGKTVNLASRLQSVAKAGEAFFSESTWVMVNRTEVGAEELSPVELKGFAGAVRVFRAM